MLGITDRVFGLMDANDELTIWLNECKLYNESQERKATEQAVTITAMNGSLKQLERKVSSLQDAINLSQKTSEEVMDSNAENRTVLQRNMENVAKSVPTRFIGTIMSIRKAIS